MAYTCSICGSEFSSRQALGGHTRGHKKQQKLAKKEAKAEQEVFAEANAEANAEAKRLEQNQAESQVNIQEEAVSKMLPANNQADVISKTPAMQLSNPATSVATAQPGKMSAEDLAWLNAQLDTPVTQAELDVAQQRMNAKYEQMEQEAAIKAAALRAPPPPPDPGYVPRPPGIPDRIAGQIDWNGLSQAAMNLLIEIVKERRAARAGPSLAEQIGNLAISNFAQQLSRERGRALGKRVVDPDEEYVQSPVEQTMLDMMTKQIEEDRKNREEMAERYDKLLKDIEAARKQYNERIENIKEKVIDTSYRTESPSDTPEIEAAEHEQPEVPQESAEGAEA